MVQDNADRIRELEQQLLHEKQKNAQLVEEMKEQRTKQGLYVRIGFLHVFVI